MKKITQLLLLINLFILLSSCSDLIEIAGGIQDDSLKPGLSVEVNTSIGERTLTLVDTDNDGKVDGIRISGLTIVECTLSRSSHSGNLELDLNADGFADAFISLNPAQTLTITRSTNGIGPEVIFIEDSGQLVGFDFDSDGKPEVTIPSYDNTPPYPPTIQSYQIFPAYYSVDLTWTNSIDPTDEDTGHFSNPQDISYLVFYTDSAHTSELEYSILEESWISAGPPRHNINTIRLSGLKGGVAYSIVVVAIDSAGNKGISIIHPSYIASPTPTFASSIQGKVTSYSSENIVIVTWSKAVDESSSGIETPTPEPEMKYWLYYSMSDNIRTLEGINSNGTLVSGFPKLGSELPNDGEEEIRYDVTGLGSAVTSIFFNVIAEDDSGHKLVYTSSPES